MASKARQSNRDSTAAGKDKEVRTVNKGDLRRIRTGATSQSATGTPVRERISYLQKEHEALAGHMNMYLGRVEHFLWENKLLEEEAKRNRKQSSVYLSYLTKHSQKCQDLVIALCQQNERDLSQVQAQKEELISQYAAKEKEVRGCLMDIETKCSQMSREVEELQPFKELQSEQRQKIKELEKELLVMKMRHSEEMHKVRSRFLQTKADCEEGARHKILVLSRRQEAAAMQSLIEHIRQVKAENRHLRKELLRLIQCSKVLKETEGELREQQQQLIREQRCTQDMARARHRLHRQEAHGAEQETRSSHSPFKRGY